MSYGWIPSSSLVATKYQRRAASERPMMPGERFSVSREMDRNLKGYKEVRLGLQEAREVVARQARQRQSVDRTIQTSYYKSPVGCRRRGRWWPGRPGRGSPWTGPSRPPTTSPLSAAGGEGGGGQAGQAEAVRGQDHPDLLLQVPCRLQEAREVVARQARQRQSVDRTIQ